MNGLCLITEMQFQLHELFSSSASSYLQRQYDHGAIFPDTIAHVISNVFYKIETQKSLDAEP